MLRRLAMPAARLFADRRGVASIIFGLTFVALMIFAGMTVDVARLEFVRERLISATDAAALAGAHTINSSGTGSGYVKDADNFFNANFPSGYLGSTNPANPTVTLSSDGTQLIVSETVSLPLMFGKLLNHVSPMPVSYASTALAGRVEVAMVLDNSGSMSATVSGDSQSKIALLQSAASSFASSLTSLNNGSVRIAVVPFASTVNTGYTQSTAPSWIDPSASYMYSNDPLTGALPTNALTVSASNTTGTAFQDVFTTTSGANSKQNRFTLFTAIHKANSASPLWQGCVEMRPPVYSSDGSERFDVNDTYPTTASPGSLIVPFFAPAEAKTPVSGSNNTPNYSYLFFNHYLTDYSTDDASASNWKIAQGDYNKYTSPSLASGASYTAAQTTQSSLNYTYIYPYGPNAGCQGFQFSGGNATSTLVTLEPLLRLTTSANTVSSTLSAMVAMSETYLPIGLFWGWEMISPTSVFSDSQAAYKDPGITKVVILLTDGCNELINPGTAVNSATNTCGNATSPTSDYGITFPNQSDYTAVGYSWQYRAGPLSANPNPSSDPLLNSMSDRQTVADTETTTMCANMKADGIQIYTIGIDSQGSVNPALSTCASGTYPANLNVYYFSTPDPANLTSVFTQIAASLTTVRLLAPAGSSPGI